MKKGLPRDLDFSKSETTMPSDTDFESDYVTGLEDFPNEKTIVRKPRLRRKPFKGLNDPRQTSAFIQNILTEDSKTGVAVVDLFVAVKSVKDNLDYLARRNDDIFHQINALNAESGVVRAEYRNLAENVRSLLEELNDEPKTPNLPEIQTRAATKCDNVQDKSVRDQVEGSCPNRSKNASGGPECIVSALRSSINDRSGISETLLGSFLASALWLQKREISLSNREGKTNADNATIQMIYDICEVVGGFTESESEPESEERWSETEEQSSRSPKKFCRTSSSAESSESESPFEEAFATPPPSPTASSFEIKPKLSAFCMGDLTKEKKKKNVSTGTDGERASVDVTTLTEGIKSTLKYLESKRKAAITEQPIEVPDKDLKKFPKAADLASGPSREAIAFDVLVKKQEEPRSYSMDSIEFLDDFDSENVETSSVSGDEEMEDFPRIGVPTSKSDSKAICPRSQSSNAPKVTTYKAAKPTFFEVWKQFPKLFVQDVISRTAKIKQEKSWEVKNYKNVIAQEAVAFVSGEQQKKELVIENSNLDLVIYIEVEVEDDGKKKQLALDFRKNSQGTQTSDSENGSPIQQGDRKQSENLLCNVWRKSDTNETAKVEESVRTSSAGTEELHEKELLTKTVSSGENVPQIVTENIAPRELSVKYEKAAAVVMVMKKEILTAKLYFEQQKSFPFFFVERPKPFYRIGRNVELEKALKLIREIENDVVETKVSDAISILPRLESELRKHFRHKAKSLGNPELEDSADNFFSAFDVWPVQVIDSGGSEGSEERLFNLLTLLDHLEKAVKVHECSTKTERCGYNSSKIYGLLHALTESIRELEHGSNVASLSRTLDIASRLDSAVREYDNVVKRTPTEYVASVQRQNGTWSKPKTSEEGLSREHLRKVRKKVFELVEEEAVDTEARLAKDSDKLERLERENNEAMKFVEAFLQKTERRATELASVKLELKELSEAIASTTKDLINRRNSKKEKSPEESGVVNSKEGDELVKGTVSGLLVALNSLKSRARKKNLVCKEILSRAGSEKEIAGYDSLQRCSRSSFPGKNSEELHSWVKEFKKIGDRSLYLSWTKPEGPLADSVVSYEIFVNGKLNQKVRNPQRLQAVLYSVDLSRTTEVLLYGLLENGFRIFLSTVNYETS